MILKNCLNYSATDLATTIIYGNYKESKKHSFSSIVVSIQGFNSHPETFSTMMWTVFKTRYEKRPMQIFT